MCVCVKKKRTEGKSLEEGFHDRETEERRREDPRRVPSTRAKGEKYPLALPPLFLGRERGWEEGQYIYIKQVKQKARTNNER